MSQESCWVEGSESHVPDSNPALISEPRQRTAEDTQSSPDEGSPSTQIGCARDDSFDTSSHQMLAEEDPAISLPTAAAHCDAHDGKHATQLDKKATWDQIELSYWESIRKDRNRQDTELHQYMAAETSYLKHQLAEKYAEQNRLTLAQTALGTSIKNLEHSLDQLSSRFEAQCQKMEHERHNDDQCKRHFFAQHRSQNPPPLSAKVSPQEHVERLIEEDLRQTSTQGLDQQYQRSLQSHDTNHSADFNGMTAESCCSALPRNAPLEPLFSAQVVDSQGRSVAAIYQIPEFTARHSLQKVDNRGVNRLINIPSKRTVVLRAGRVFGDEQHTSIFRPTDAKCSEWIGIMIQAKGDIQDPPCLACVKKIGMFRDCVAIRDPNFPCCGNCEWGHQACSFSDSPTDLAPPREAITTPDPAGVMWSSSSHVVSTMPPNSATFTTAAHGPDVQSTGSHEKPMEFAAYGMTSMPHSRPTTAARALMPHPLAPGINTPMIMVTHQAAMPQRLATGPTFSQFPVDPSIVSTRGLKRAASEDDEEFPLPEITRVGLVLRDDGDVFTHPELMRGVPLRRIYPSDGYWENEWQDVEEIIKPQLDRWINKLEQIKLMENSSSAYKFQANRQVNRGQAILRFFGQADFSPYQLVAKGHMNVGIMTYDTLFRLVATIEELIKFTSIDVTPLQWVRQRLCEVYDEDPVGFNLSKKITEFYHDSKLVQLRKRNGFGNIGRPSGNKTTKEKDGRSATRSEKKTRKPDTITRSTLQPEIVMMTPSAPRMPMHLPPPDILTSMPPPPQPPRRQSMPMKSPGLVETIIPLYPPPQMVRPLMPMPLHQPPLSYEATAAAAMAATNRILSTSGNHERGITLSNAAPVPVDTNVPSNGSYQPPGSLASVPKDFHNNGSDFVENITPVCDMDQEPLVTGATLACNENSSVATVDAPDATDLIVTTQTTFVDPQPPPISAVTVAVDGISKSEFPVGSESFDKPAHEPALADAGSPVSFISPAPPASITPPARVPAPSDETRPDSAVTSNSAATASPVAAPSASDITETSCITTTNTEAPDNNCTTVSSKPITPSNNAVAAVKNSRPEPTKKKSSAGSQQRASKKVTRSSTSVSQRSREDTDLLYDGYTSTDSYSDDIVRKGDWRIYQIKTRYFTSNEHVTQYWHWGDGLFQHQVLQDVQPTITWGLYQDPINFHLKLSHIEDIFYAPASLKIVIAVASQGTMADNDVLVHFKRERTKRRFLSFCQRKGISLAKVTS